MPTTDPSISVTKSKELLQQTDKLIKTFPEVASVHGKIGRADTATDPAPLSMIETVVQLHTDAQRWRTRPVRLLLQRLARLAEVAADADVLAGDSAASRSTSSSTAGPIRTARATRASTTPSASPASPTPGRIRSRTASTCSATGIKTPVGIKILGPGSRTCWATWPSAPRARCVRWRGTLSAYPERTFGGYYLDFDIDRDAAARYGLTTGDVQDVIQTAVGGMNVTTTVEGLERYPLNVRYARELRDDIPALRAGPRLDADRSAGAARPARRHSRSTPGRR